MSSDKTTLNRKSIAGQNNNAGLFAKYLPILNWLPRYKREDLTGDLMAGVIVAIMLVPQSMAYANLAGLPPQVGLYASIVPIFIYAIFGTSRTMAIGPGAMLAFLIFSGVGTIAEAGTAEFVALTLILALMVGVIQLLMGIVRLGFLVNFLSHPVIIGFMSVSAVVIGLSQLKHLLGINVPDAEHQYQKFINTAQNLFATNWATFGIGFGSILIMYYFKNHLTKNLERLKISPLLGDILSKVGPLFAVLLSTLIVWGFGLNSTSGVKIVGDIPAGLPLLTIPSLDPAKIYALFPIAVIISLIAFMESVSIATTLASKRRQKIDANQELIALGFANIGAAFTGGHPVNGGLSRSFVNFNAGANTGLASIITATLIGVTVLYLTPLFFYLPHSVLAAIAIVAVASLVDLNAVKQIWIYSKLDAIAMLTTFFGALIFSIEAGIGIGVAASLLLYLYRTSKPHVAVVGRVGDTEHFRNVLRHEVKTCPETIAIRIDESLYFANTKELENCLHRAVADDLEIKNVVLICNAVNFIDASALETLERVIEELNSAGVKLYLTDVKGPVTDRLEKVGFIEHFGRENIFLSTHEAMEFLGCK